MLGLFLSNPANKKIELNYVGGCLSTHDATNQLRQLHNPLLGSDPLVMRHCSRLMISKSQWAVEQVPQLHCDDSLCGSVAQCSHCAGNCLCMLNPTFFCILHLFWSWWLHFLVQNLFAELCLAMCGPLVVRTNLVDPEWNKIQTFPQRCWLGLPLTDVVLRASQGFFPSQPHWAIVSFIPQLSLFSPGFTLTPKQWREQPASLLHFMYFPCDKNCWCFLLL